MTYTELSRLPASAYLSPDLFITPLDYAPGADYPAKQYAQGLAIGQEYDTITLSVRGVWSAENRLPGGRLRSIQSYEGIGYHSGTAALLRGFLASPAAIVVYRAEPDGITETVIRDRDDSAYA